MHSILCNPHSQANPVLSTLDTSAQKYLMSPATVLLAEDDSDLRLVMACTLRCMGLSVIACANAQHASAAFRSHTGIDLLVTDFEMPGRSGLELARELTALCPELRVMIVTASILPEEMMCEIEARHWTYVSKPCHPASLAADVEATLYTDAATQPNALTDPDVSWRRAEPC